MRCLRAALPAFLAASLLASTALAAPPNVLGNGSVSPGSGLTTTTTFTFSVDYAGANDATAVTAEAPGLIVSLTRVFGSAANGTWRASRKLPAGTWTFTFHASATAKNSPTLPGPTIVVTGPTPVPTPTPPPTPRPTPRPTLVPATATAGPGASLPPVSPTPFGTVTSPSGSPGGSQVGASSAPASASPSLSPDMVPPGRLFNVPIEGVVAIGLLGAVTVAAALGERRRRAAFEAFRAAEASNEVVPPGDGLDEAVERDEVDDETVATIDYDSPDEVS